MHAPSSTRIERSTSIVKSTCPGVSMILNAMLGEILAHAFPEACGRRRCNGDTTFLFLLHPVHGGRAVMNFANLVIDAGIKQNTLGGSGLSGVDMRRNSDIAIAVDGSLAGHLIYLPYLNQTAMTPCFTKRQGGGQKRKSRRRPDETRCHLETEMRERLVGFCHTVNFFTLFHRCTAPLLMPQATRRQGAGPSTSRCACVPLPATSAWTAPCDGTGAPLQGPDSLRHRPVDS
jgi:hypothetical protein